MSTRKSGIASSRSRSADQIVALVVRGNDDQRPHTRLFPGPLEAQRRDLFRDQPDEKDDHGEQDEDHRAVGNLARCVIMFQMP